MLPSPNQIYTAAEDKHSNALPPIQHAARCEDIPKWRGMKG